MTSILSSMVDLLLTMLPEMGLNVVLDQFNQNQEELIVFFSLYFAVVRLFRFSID